MKPRSIRTLKIHAAQLAADKGHKIMKWRADHVASWIRTAQCYFCGGKIGVNGRPHDTEAEVFGELLTYKCGENTDALKKETSV